MGTKNISISEEAYQRLAAIKQPNESFTQVINRLTKKRSILELAGTLTNQEAAEIQENIKKLRQESTNRITATINEVETP